MPRITIETDAPPGGAARITLSERVLSEHLRDGHSANQLLERLRWAVGDATDSRHASLRTENEHIAG